MTTIEIDGDRVAAYSAGIAERSPRHNDPDHAQFAGAPLIVANAIIPGTGALLFTLGLGSKLSRIVHAGIDIDLRRPIVAGDTLTCTAVHRCTEDKGSGDLVSMGYELKDADGAVVCEGESRYFIRGAKKGAGGHGKEAADDPGSPTHVVSETVEPGQSLLYAEGAGDRFPIHTDPKFARSVGLPDVIVHGMCTLAFATRAVVDTVAEGDSSRLKRVSVRFAKIVLHEDTLTTRIWAAGADGAVRFETVNQRGEAVLIEGVAEIG